MFNNITIDLYVLDRIQPEAVVASLTESSGENVHINICEPMVVKTKVMCCMIYPQNIPNKLNEVLS